MSVCKYMPKFRPFSFPHFTCCLQFVSVAQDDLPAGPLQGQQPGDLVQAGGAGLALRHTPRQPQDHGCGEFSANLPFLNSQTADFIFH